MKAATAEDREGQELSSLIREFDQLKNRIVSDVNRLHGLAQQIDRQASTRGDAHVALVARGTYRHLAAMGQGLGRMRSLRTAERTNVYQREEEQREEDLRNAARDVLAARREARREAAQVQAQAYMDDAPTASQAPQTPEVTDE